MTTQEFTRWLEEEMRKRGWQPSDLANAAKMYSSTLSRILNQERKASPETCVAIANALNLPAEEVFRRAGLLPERPVYDIRERRALFLFSRLPESIQQYILTTMEAFVDEQEQETAAERPEPRNEPR